MVETVIGIILILLAAWQFYATKKAFVQLKRHGNQNTSRFIALALWNGFAFSVILLGAGIMLSLNAINLV
ncbi:immunity protein [Lactiplantibacillus modestisalitolerans]|uniref:Immunity protein n=1 Tax=Lactiplantibacillus modestisalitolerans TaxID=1457219 RepID=A0ABV5WTI4_9LACO|nr:immunity protein [Lactiplantibacillus modestisalitolerans]